MGLSHRMLLIDRDDRLYRLPSTKFMVLLQNPDSYRFPQSLGSEYARQVLPSSSSAGDRSKSCG